MREPIIREISVPPRVSWLEPRLASLSAAVRSLKPKSLPPEPPRASRRNRWLLGLAAGTALGGIVALLVSPREPEPRVVSGSPRLKYTDQGQAIRWHKAKLTLSIDPSFEALHPGARDAVLVGFDTWRASHPGLPQLSFDLTTTSRQAGRDGINLVTYAEIEQPGFQHALAITVAYSDASTGKIVEADIIVNSRQELAVVEQSRATPEHDDEQGKRGHDDKDDPHEDEESGCRHAYDLQSVITHEVGHFWGLGEDEVETEATMYYKTARCDLRQRDLIETDVQAVESVYAEPLEQEPDDVASASCRVGRGEPTRPARGAAWGLLCAALALAARRKQSG